MCFIRFLYVALPLPNVCSADIANTPRTEQLMETLRSPATPHTLQAQVQHFWVKLALPIDLDRQQRCPGPPAPAPLPPLSTRPP